ncbi:right-handed parallel beta-helix repeat-containing protein [Singulisphaera acidiphila]|uniref:Uncharacterized protein n=1 Tax=Singulisphaera acidiphila (strain ATCC BAA-1392 / DSM 18658 / VKM B-2454 / MOB10) TaxID=886293 RepID=L0DHG6_SINAD|nr:right-handed parallel beta-helix repeat-containing protein [Singulisphaera acidiphila]AGA28258.1 hypothetical protein Sinac_4035 [Singulisphaera acidiphila DSM 18658]
MLSPVSPPTRRNRTGRRAWTLERLEERAVPATITVTSLADDGPGTLRAAITQANADTAADTILFAQDVRGTITLETALPDLSTTINIQGPGAKDLTVARNVWTSTPFSTFEVVQGADVILSGLTITGGTSLTAGGGINNSGELVVSNCTVSGNRGEYGGISNVDSGYLTIVDSTISGNRGPSFFGGGIYNSQSSTLAIHRSTISGNDSGTMGTSSGGGINNRGLMGITNSTISGNKTMGSGGGIYNGGTLTIISSTISGNATTDYRGSGEGGGIFNSGSMNILSSIVSGNKSSIGPMDISGAGNSLGYNIFFDVPDISLNPTDQTRTDAMLAPLADNGGPTFTQALLPGSPAIDSSVTINGVNTDQRNVPRPQGNAPDIGAFEAVGVVGARPTVVSLVRSSLRNQPTKLVLTFSAAMSSANAQDVSNYTLVPSGPAGRTRLHTRPIPITSAVYDPAAKTVTLTSRRLDARAYFRLTASGTPPAGLKSPNGVFLDGSGRGLPGSNYVAVIHGARALAPRENLAIKTGP